MIRLAFTLLAIALLTGAFVTWRLATDDPLWDRLARRIMGMGDHDG